MKEIAGAQGQYTSSKRVVLPPGPALLEELQKIVYGRAVLASSEMVGMSLHRRFVAEESPVSVAQELASFWEFLAGAEELSAFFQLVVLPDLVALSGVSGLLMKVQVRWVLESVLQAFAFIVCIHYFAFLRRCL